jgi:Ca2+-binding RTX toxin-like protein
VNFSFSELVSGFDASDVTLANGALSGLTSSDGKLWTATFTPDAGVQASVNSIAVGTDYTDAAGNAGTAGASANFTIDTTLPAINYINGTNGSDTLVGSAVADVLNGVPAVTTLYGRGSIDTLTGNAGNDVFVLGIAGRAFYDDGVSKNLGTGDYARITDFTAGADDLQLAAARSYVFAATSVAGGSGLGVYIDVNGNGKLDVRSDEMIGLLVGVNSIHPADIVLV